MQSSYLRSLMANTWRLLADRNGTVFIQYTSIALLIAIAALAYLTSADSHPLAL